MLNLMIRAAWTLCAQQLLGLQDMPPYPPLSKKDWSSHERNFFPYQGATIESTKSGVKSIFFCEPASKSVP